MFRVIVLVSLAFSVIVKAMQTGASIGTRRGRSKVTRGSAGCSAATVQVGQQECEEETERETGEHTEGRGAGGSSRADGGQFELRGQEGGQGHVGHQRRTARVNERVDLLGFFAAGFNLGKHTRHTHCV